MLSGFSYGSLGRLVFGVEGFHSSLHSDYKRAVGLKPDFIGMSFGLRWPIKKPVKMLRFLRFPALMSRPTGDGD